MYLNTVLSKFYFYGYASMRAEFHIQCHFLCDETLKTKLEEYFTSM